MGNFTMEHEGVITFIGQSSGPEPAPRIVLSTGESDTINGSFSISVIFEEDVTDVKLEVKGGPSPPQYSTFNIGEDKRTVTMPRGTYRSYSMLKLIVEYENVEPEPEPPSEIGTFNYVYLINNENLRKVTGAVVVSPDNSEPDLTRYILEVVRLPFKIDDELISETDGIVIGNKKFTSIDVKEVSTDLIEVDGGEIFTPLKYNNSLDFINTDCILHLPFSDNISLNSAYVINETISIKYYISLYDGTGTVVISSSKIGDVFHVENVSVGRTIPYFNYYQKTSNKSSPTVTPIYNALETAYIEVIRNIPLNVDSFFNNEVVEEGKLENIQGYVRVEAIESKSFALLDEKEMILGLLRNGVIIK